MIIKTTKHPDIRRDMKKKKNLTGRFGCIDKHQKSRGTVKIRFTG